MYLTVKKVCLGHCACMLYHFGYRGESNTSHMVLGTFHIIYITYISHLTSDAYAFWSRGQGTISYMGEQATPCSIYGFYLGYLRGRGFPPKILLKLNLC